jgi:hypothetical protein
MFNKIVWSLLLVSSMAQAQQLIKPDGKTRVCAAVGTSTLTEYKVREAGPKPKKIIGSVLKLLGVNADRFMILATNDIDNAIALVSDGKRYILYNPNFIGSIDENEPTYYPSLCLLAHEIGHHVNLDGLTDCEGNGCRAEELAADKFAGCALLRAQASELDLKGATSWMSPNGDTEHPPRAARQQKVQEGYQECIGETKPCTQKRTGEIWFRNKTGKAIEVILESDSNIKTTIEPNGTGLLTVPAGSNRFRINRESAMWHDANNPTRGTMMRYKDETHRVVQCAENPPPIDIR